MPWPDGPPNLNGALPQADGFPNLIGVCHPRRCLTLAADLEKYNLAQDDYVYIGDDINDLECLNYAKYKITVPHAVEKVKAVDGIQITESFAGDGAFREVADCLTSM